MAALMTMVACLILFAPAAAADTPPASNIGSRPPVLPGQLSSMFGINPANPEGSVPTSGQRDRNPLEFGYFLQDLLEKAEQAQKAKDFDAVVRYYRAVARAVPDNAKSWSKLCEAYERVHDRERAIRACKYAIERPAVELGDYVRYVHLIIAGAADLSGAERTELGAVLDHLDRQTGTAIAVSHLRCELGVKLKDVGILERCTKALATLAPDDPKTVVFQWSLAVMKGDETRARDLLIRARATGVMRDNVMRMEAVTPSSGTPRHRLVIAGLTAIAAIALGSGLFVLVRRRRALSSRVAA